MADELCELVRIGPSRKGPPSAWTSGGSARGWSLAGRPAGTPPAWPERTLRSFVAFTEAWTADDLEAALELVDPEVVARPLHGVLFTQAEYRGREGIAQWYEEMKRPWDRFDITVEHVWETDDGAVGILHVVGRRGDEAFDARVGSVCRLREGRIVSLRAREVETVEEELEQ